MQREKGSYSRQCSHRPVSSVSQVSQRKELLVGQIKLDFWALKIYRHRVMRTHFYLCMGLRLGFLNFFFQKLLLLTQLVWVQIEASDLVSQNQLVPLMGDSNTHSNPYKLEGQNTAVHTPGGFRYWTHLGDAGNAKVFPVKLEGIKSQSVGHHLENKSSSSGAHICTKNYNSGSDFSHCHTDHEARRLVCGDTYSSDVLSDVDPSVKLKLPQCLSQTAWFSFFILHGLCRQSML